MTGSYDYPILAAHTLLSPIAILLALSDNIAPVYRLLFHNHYLNESVPQDLFGRHGPFIRRYICGWSRTVLALRLRIHWNSRVASRP